MIVNDKSNYYYVENQPCFVCGKKIDEFPVVQLSGNDVRGDGIEIAIHPVCAFYLTLNLMVDINETL